MEKLNQRPIRHEQGSLNDGDIERCASTQFSKLQKNQLIQLQKHLERYCNVLHVLDFNSAKYDFNLIKPYLLRILVNERNIEPSVIKEVNQFILFKFGYIQLLDILEVLGGTTSRDSFLKALKIQKQEDFSPTNALITLT